MYPGEGNSIANVSQQVLPPKSLPFAVLFGSGGLCFAVLRNVFRRIARNSDGKEVSTAAFRSLRFGSELPYFPMKSTLST